MGLSRLKYKGIGWRVPTRTKSTHDRATLAWLSCLVRLQSKERWRGVRGGGATRHDPITPPHQSSATVATLNSEKHGPI